MILGGVGDNFAAGMTGGMAFVYDADGMFEHHVNSDSVVWQRVETRALANVLRSLIEEHRAETDSVLATRNARANGTGTRHFWQVVPKEMVTRLAHPLRNEQRAAIPAE